MNYFPRQSELTYTCRGCSNTYIKGSISCCVMHAPGTCCHYGDTLVNLPQRSDSPSIAANPLRLAAVATFPLEKK